MIAGFQTAFAGFTPDGRNWTATRALEYVRKDGTRLCAVVGFTTDGPSIPDHLQGMVSPVGPLFLCGALHDAAYRAYLEKFDGAQCVPWVPTKPESDLLFLEAMELCGIGLLHREAIYEAVHLFGHSAFDQDRIEARAAGRIV